MNTKFIDAIKEKIILFDGGMGTMLIEKGMQTGEVPESLNLNNPQIVREVHKEYLDAGSDAVLTNTFGGTSIKLADNGLQNSSKEINRVAAEIAHSADKKKFFVVGDIGPSGKILEPYGELTEADLRKSFEIQINGLLEGEVDAIIFETQMDLRETLIGLNIAKKLSTLPVITSFTFNKSARGFFTLMGNSVKDIVQNAEDAGADIVGTNCSLDSSEMKDLIMEINKFTELPIYAKANAGAPELSNGKVAYAQSVEDYMKDMPVFLDNGVRLLGGCCGTNPSFIAALRKMLNESGN